MPTLGTVSRTISDENLQALASIAWYGGINYWAESVPLEECPPGTFMGVHEREDTTAYFYLTGRALKEAFYKVVERKVEVADYIVTSFREAWDERDAFGLDMGVIDAEAADVWVQVACFGSVIYG